MYQILKDLYRGEIIPQEQPAKTGPEHKRAMAALEEIEPRLKGKLDEQGQALLNEYLKAHDDLGWEDCLNAFIEGFRLGGRFILALFSENP